MPILLPLLILPSLAAAQVEDPAPPKVQELATIEAPSARAVEGLTTHRAPRTPVAGARTEDWPSFLGPRRDGTSIETGLAAGWGEAGPPLVWELEVGEGYSQPAVAGGRVIVQHRTGAESHVDCLDALTGRRYWRYSFPCDYRGRYISDGGPCASPTIDDGWVYVHSIEGRLFCLELSTGRVRWQRDLRAEFELPGGFFGVVSSPLVVGDFIYQNVGVPGPTVACFEKATGALVWGAGDSWGASCASPVMAQVHGSSRLLVMTGGDSRPPTGGLMVLDPGGGEVLATYPFRSRTYESVNAASPLMVGGGVFLTASYGVGSAVLSVDSDGGLEERWRDRRAIGLQFSNPVTLGGLIYAIDGTSGRAGELVCVDPGTGEELSRTSLGWEETVVYKGQEKELDFSVGEASLLVVGERLLCLGDQGHLLWLEVSREGARIAARASLFRAAQSWTPPALSGGLLYVRQTMRERFGAEPRSRRVLCFDLRE
jgi:outer membrane protein assembly factor BamB